MRTLTPIRRSVGVWWIVWAHWLGVAMASRGGPEVVVLGNSQLELRFRRDGERIEATALMHRVAGRTIRLSGDDFGLHVEGRPTLHMADFALRDVMVEKITGGRRMNLRFVQRGARWELAVIYELLDAENVIRRHLEYVPETPVSLDRVEVWSVGLRARCLAQEQGPPEYMRHNVWDVEGKHGFGLPVLLEDTFWGLEFPAGYHRYENGIVKLSHAPGRMISNRFVSKTAVVGVTAPGHVIRDFRAYIERGRARPKQPPVQVDYNTWTTVMPATEANSLGLIGQFRTNLFDRYGVGFDSFTLDDGWDRKDSLWETRTNGFSRGFRPLLDRLAPMGTKLGLWFSPSSGYEHAGWGGKQGYARNASFDWFLCQSDPAYRRDMARVMPGIVRENDVGFFKMDGFCASCGTNSHAHHGDGDRAREANVEAFIELIGAMRRAKPGVYLNPTSGMWLSPWWLWHVDSVWCDTYDGTAPAIIPSPNGLDGATTSRDALLRRRLSANLGFDPGAVDTLGVYLDPTLSIEPRTFLENWQDNAMMVGGRGNRLLNFYLNPETLPNPSKDWPFLAGMIQWTRHNAGTLARTEMILGDPYELEPYGYAHFDGQRGILALRNPFIQPRKVRLRLDASVGWSEGVAGTAPWVATVVYPYRETLRQAPRFGDVLELELESYETLVVHVDPVNRAGLMLPGIRSRAVQQTARRMTWEVAGMPGTKVVLPLGALPEPERISWNGQDVRPKGNGEGQALPLRFDGVAGPCTVKGGTWNLEGAGGASRVAGRCVATIPAGTKAIMYVLRLDSSPSTNAVTTECLATVNGRAVPVTSIRHPVGPRVAPRLVRELPLKPWAFFHFEVPEGTHEITVSLGRGELADKSTESQFGWWLWTEQPLRKGTLTMNFAETMAEVPVDPLPYPSGMDSKRRVLTIQPLKSMR